MEQPLLDPFINATVSVIQTMAGIKPEPGGAFIKQDEHAFGVVSGVIGLASDTLRGVMIISFDERSILKIASKMLFEEFHEVSSDVIDAVGELTNIIVGNAKREFSEKNYIFDMATPLMLKGHDLKISQFVTGITTCLPFTIEDGLFRLEVNFCEPRTLFKKSHF